MNTRTNLFKFALILCLLGVLAACSSTKKEEKPDLSKPPPNQLPVGGAQTAPLDPGAGGSGTALPGEAEDTAARLPQERVIHFDYDRSDIREIDRATLEAHAKYLQANPEISVRLEGHADERGSREYNLALGERRAQSSKRYLNILGVGEAQLTTFSYGEEKALAVGHDEVSWAQNRRVEIIYPGGL